jgi:hypothetical protein
VRRSEHASVMLAALVVVAVAAAVAAALATRAHTELVLARNRDAATRAQAAADGCLAGVVAGLPAGWDFAEALAGPDATAGTGDDGVVPTPPGCSATLAQAPGPAVPPRVLADVVAVAGAGRRLVRGVVGRAPSPGPPALLWLAEAATLRPVGGTLTLDGTDAGRPAAPPLAPMAAPGDPAALDAWIAAQGAHVTTSPARALHAPRPPVAELADRLRAAGAALTGTLVPGGVPPLARTWSPGDLVVAGNARGRGLLLVEGLLDITGAFEFNGVVVASGGIRVAAGARLEVRGVVWLGPDATFVGDGDAAVRADGDALESADDLLALPRRALLAGLRDPP